MSLRKETIKVMKGWRWVTMLKEEALQKGYNIFRKETK